MRLVITSPDASSPVRFDMLGMRFEVSGLEGRQLVIDDAYGVVDIQLSEDTFDPYDVAANDAVATSAARDAGAAGTPVIVDGIPAILPGVPAASVPVVPAPSSPVASTSAAAGWDDGQLFQALVSLRSHIAQAQGRQPYLIFHDDTLRAISTGRPSTPGELLAVKGIGQAKAEQYGAAVLALVRKAAGKEAA